MATPPITIRKTVDNVATLLARVATLVESEVLVGVPADKAPRSGGQINNATLAYIHNFGSPARNIPARPFLTQGVRKVRAQVLAELRKGAADVLTGGGNVDATLNRIGMLARNAVVQEITDPEPAFVPLKPATIRARMRKTQAGRRQLRKLQLGAQQSGSTIAAALLQYAGAGNITPLVDTGALRRSISFAVRKVGR
jgi:hypothetical protein